MTKPDLYFLGEIVDQRGIFYRIKLYQTDDSGQSRVLLRKAWTRNPESWTQKMILKVMEANDMKWDKMDPHEYGS